MTLEEMGLPKIRQIGIVVKDLNEAMKKYHTLLGVGPFRGFVVDSNDLPGITYRGKPADYQVRLAMAQVGDYSIELIDNRRGENSYTEFFSKHGEGVHHFGIFPNHYEAAYNRLAEQGYTHLQGGPIYGKNRNGKFDYFETEKDFGVILELLDVPEDPENASIFFP
jgi:hypothetical protein